MAIQNVTQNEKNALRQRTVLSLPDRPSDHGFTSEQVKNAIALPIVGNTNSVIAILERIIDEVILYINTLHGKLTVLGEDSYPLLKTNSTKLFEAVNELKQKITSAGNGEYGTMGTTATTIMEAIAELRGILTNEESGYTALSTNEQTLGEAINELYDITTVKADLVDGKVPASQLPSYVDDVLEYNSTGDFPVTGETGKIYVAKDTNNSYRWSGSSYILLLTEPDTISKEQIDSLFESED